MRTPSRGFTLIELLVVIAIIGLLSSIVLASLNTARAKAKDAAVRSEVEQIRTLMELNYNDYGSYSNLSTNAGWVSTQYSCATYPATGNYASQLRSICNTIANSETSGSNYFYLGVNSSVAGANTNTYSILAWLPGAGTFLCMGSSGAVSTDPGSWNNAGCWNNP